MIKQTKTQSFNADAQTLNYLSRVKMYKMSKDCFIREAIYAYYRDTILPHELNIAKQRKNKDVPF